MVYDFHGAWEKTIDFHSPLYSRDNQMGNQSFFNVDWAVNYWIKNGFPREKLVLGLAAYGRVFKLKYTDQYLPGALNDNAGTRGRVTRNFFNW